MTTYATELKEMRDANRDPVPELPTIEKGVAIPPNRSFFSHSRLPALIAQMEVGDSFYCEEIDSRSVESVQGTVSYCTKKLNANNTGLCAVKFTTRSYPATSNKPRGVRVWRIK
jgi:hypothetical protein